ncbi:MAG: endonuclease/exonuclease/phosphatase family protein [Anaerolineae bacterium]|nr:endonuclease/exonuclease/phosphatase family protein [Anaerolineae bacterium]
MRNRLRLRLQHLYLLEAALVGMLFIGAARFLIASLYSRAGSASIVLSLDPALIPASIPGIVDAETVTNEFSFVIYMLAIPLLTIILGRLSWLSLVGVLLVAVGRVLMLASTVVTPVTAAALVFGGGLLYIAMIVRHRAQILPYMFVFGIAADQILRAVGNTLDPTLSTAYLDTQITVSAVLVIIALITLVVQTRQKATEQSAVNPDRGLIPLWGGVGLGALLFLELSLLSLPNAVAGRASVDYTSFAPFITLATLLPIIPWVRNQATYFVGLFDRNARGWLWMLLMALLIVFGTRFQGILAGASLVIAQFTVSMLWWWLVRPRAEKERQFTAIWLLVSVIIFVLLTAADNFTYEYGYVQNLTGDLAFLNPYIPPFLRAFRGFGLGVLLLAVFFAALPVIQTQRRIPWTTGTSWQSILGIAAVALASIGVAVAVRPPQINLLLSTEQNPVNSIRIGTYNIHAGFNEFYHFDMEAIARTIQQSGADVVLLQQVEVGRMTSYGVDQALWLARRLGMDVRFFPTNEGLQGLAVLSRVLIIESDGTQLTSSGSQTGLQRVRIQPDEGVINIYNTRLEYLLDVGDGRTVEQQEQDQQRQINEIFAILANQYPDGNLGRLLIGGTFNNIPDSPLADQMRAAGFVDPFAGTGLPSELSATLWRTGVPRVQLDYLWLWRRSLVPIGANTVNSQASDHRMVVIEAFIQG